MSNDKHLLHLEGAIPKEDWGYTISGYAVALEAWRRGLTIEFVNRNRSRSTQFYRISSKNHSHLFQVARGDLVTREAIRACVNKDRTKAILLKEGVKTPLGDVFNVREKREDIIHYAKEIGYPVVIKPKDGTGGRGVITDIKDADALERAIDYLIKDFDAEDTILEKYVLGNDYRLYVLDGEVIAAYTRERAHVVGDGKATIKQLVAKKNAHREKFFGLGGNSRIQIDGEARDLLGEKGYDENTVLNSGEKVYLNSKNNVSSGGESTDKTNDISNEIKAIAVAAQKAIPGLVHGGVDMIIDEDMQTGYVLEVNSLPHIRSHLFPMNGEARDIPKAIIDFYFPETKGAPIHNILYYDFNSIYTVFKQGICASFKLPNHPVNDPLLKRYELSAITNTKELGTFINNRAKKLKVNGYVKRLASNKASLVVAGDKEKIDSLMSEIRAYDKKLQIIEKNRKTPVKIGFETIEMSKVDKVSKPLNERSVHTHSVAFKPVMPDSNPNPAEKEGYYPIAIDAGKVSVPKKKPSAKGASSKTNKNKTKPQSVKAHHQEIDYQKEYYKLMQSTSWRITKPFRFITGKLKRR